VSKPPPKLTMFYTEGNPQGMLVTATDGKTGTVRRGRNVRHATAEAALSWCRQHRAIFVYTPATEGQSGSDHSGN
jgi:hypothetical protein